MGFSSQDISYLLKLLLNNTRPLAYLWGVWYNDSKEIKMPKQLTNQEGELIRLRRIEGQIRGIQKMIEDKRYCIDILVQLSSIQGAIKRVEENILERHLKGCVLTSISKGTKADKSKKISEVIDVLGKFRK